MIQLLTYQALALLAIAVLALLPHRESGRSALYYAALTVSGVIKHIGVIWRMSAWLVAIATVMEQFPSLVLDEFHLERARDSFESQELSALHLEERIR